MTDSWRILSGLLLIIFVQSDQVIISISLTFFIISPGSSPDKCAGVLFSIDPIIGGNSSFLGTIPMFVRISPSSLSTVSLSMLIGTVSSLPSSSLRWSTNSSLSIILSNTCIRTSCHLFVSTSFTL